MVRWSDLGRPFGFRRKKTFADRVQDVAEDVVERVQDVAEEVVEVVDRAASTAASTLSTVAPVIIRSGRAADRAQGHSRAQAERAADVAAKLADRATERARAAYGGARETVVPVLAHSGRAAEGALLKTAGSAVAGLSAAKEAGKDATLAVASTGAAAAGATVGFFGTVGRLFGALLRGLWSLSVFLVKAAILVGIAYAGWQWLESRRQNEAWSNPSYAPGASGIGDTSAAPTSSAPSTAH